MMESDGKWQEATKWREVMRSDRKWWEVTESDGKQQEAMGDDGASSCYAIGII